MATADEHRTIAPIVGPDDPRHFTDSGIEIQPAYDESDLPPDLTERLGEPGAYPYTRGIHADMYRRQLWTMRQYAGYASAKESNERYRYLLSKGSTGLSMAFDLPTQLGLDSDDPRCLGEVGRTGVAIDTIDDMRTAFDQIPLDQVSTSMTINAPASVLLLLYELVGEEQGVASEQLRGTTQNDILKEYIARGNYIYPPEGAIRLTTDLFAYCNERVPKWNTVSISGYHFREKGCSAVQEVAFTLANGMAYVQAALDAGLEIDKFAPRLAFFFNGHNNVFQEVAKFRAARRMWAQIMRERFGARDERSWRLRFHTQTGGVTLTAQQPQNNIVRVALQGFAAVCGGTQSLHTNGFDEALALPTERAAKIALRTQQIIGYESGAADTVDPFAGSYFVEALTDEIETRANELIAKIDELGGSVQAIEFMTGEIEESAFGYHERYRIEQDIVVGVNKFVEESLEVTDILRVDPDSEHQQLERLKAFKADRDASLIERRLEEVRTCAAGHRQSAAGAASGAQGPLLDGRGVPGHARRVRRLPALVLAHDHARHSRRRLRRLRARHSHPRRGDRLRRHLHLSAVLRRRPARRPQRDAVVVVSRPADRSLRRQSGAARGLGGRHLLGQPTSTSGRVLRPVGDRRRGGHRRRRRLVHDPPRRASWPSSPSAIWRPPARWWRRGAATSPGARSTRSSPGRSRSAARCSICWSSSRSS